MNKNHLFCKLCIGIGLLGFVACSDDDETRWNDVDGAVPTMQLEASHLRSEQGRSITVAGTLADKDGISAVHLLCPTLHLDKTIDIIAIYGEPKTTYELNYTHPINENVSSEPHKLTVTVTDVGGRQTSQEVLVTMDADYAAPQFTSRPSEEVTVLIKDITNLKLRFGISDDKGLEQVRVVFINAENYVEPADPEAPVDPAEVIAARDAGEDSDFFSGVTDMSQALVNMKVTDFTDPKAFDFEQIFPLENEEAEYVLLVEAYDHLDNVVELDKLADHTIQFRARYKVQELPDFEKMYLADVATAPELNSDVFGVPMLCDHTDMYTYEIRYFNKTAGTEVCFIPQNTDFVPICFAPDAEDPSVLGDDPDAVKKIVLDKAGVYYHFTFNTLTRKYSYETYSIADAHDPVENFISGAEQLNTWQEWNNLNDVWWREFMIGIADNPKNVNATNRLERDLDNPHIWRSEPMMLDPGDMNFMVSNWHHDGWWFFTEWRTDDPKDPNRCFYIGRWFPDWGVIKNNDAYFNWKYGDVPGLTQQKWNNDESFRKGIVQDVWFNPTVPARGRYIFEVDFHTEHARLVPAN